MGSRTYAFDTLMQLDDGADAHTANGIGEVGGESQIIDLGGNPSYTNIADIGGIVGALARIDAMAILDVASLEVANDNNQYLLSVMGSNNSNGNDPVNLATMILGYGTLIPNGAHSPGGAPAGTGSDSAPGRFELPFTNEQNGIIYEYVYLYITVAGTDPSIQFDNAYVAVLPKE